MRSVVSLTLVCSLVLLCAAAQATNERTVLVVGDSLSIPLAKELRSFYGLQQGVEFHSSGKVSSGLARPDFHDWEAELERLARKHKPDLLFIMLGTNDHKSMPTDGGSLRFGTAAWNREYARRVQRLVDIARSHNRDVVLRWVGAPVMHERSLDRGLQQINSLIARQLHGNAGCQFIDTSKTLADASGHYTQFAGTETGRIKLRADDGVHLTRVGAAMLADRCLQHLGAADDPALTLAAARNAQESAAASKRTEYRKPQERLPIRTVAVTASSNIPAAGSYAIQESSWATPAEAKRRAGQLARKGLASWVRSIDLGSKGVWYRVMIGDFPTLDKARRHKLDLARRHSLGHVLVVRTG